MGSERMTPNGPRDQICFALYQLRDDLAELIYGLESGQMSQEQVVSGARAQLEWVLNALSEHERTTPDLTQVRPRPERDH